MCLKDRQDDETHRREDIEKFWKGCWTRSIVGSKVAQKEMSKALTLVRVNVILFGNRILTDVNKVRNLKCDHLGLGWVLNLMTTDVL